MLRAQSLRQINLLHPDIENAVQSAWPMFINRIEIDADECVQGQSSDKLKDALHDTKKSYCILRQHSVGLYRNVRSLYLDLSVRNNKEVNLNIYPLSDCQALYIIQVHLNIYLHFL